MKIIVIKCYFCEILIFYEVIIFHPSFHTWKENDSFNIQGFYINFVNCTMKKKSTQKISFHKLEKKSIFDAISHLFLDIFSSNQSILTFFRNLESKKYPGVSWASCYSISKLKGIDVRWRTHGLTSCRTSFPSLSWVLTGYQEWTCLRFHSQSLYSVHKAKVAISYSRLQLIHIRFQDQYERDHVFSKFILILN